jgi:gamma-glutamyltranspeptidase
MFCLGRICFVGYYSKFMRSLIASVLVGSWRRGAFAQDCAQARSMVVSHRGIVATSHVLASQADAQILANSGSAIDAAIAADAVLGVNEPMMDGSGAALSAPRFTIRDRGEPIGRKIVVESRVQPAVLDQLRGRGHDFVVRQPYSAMMGWGQAVLPNSKTSGNFGASDPRADGAAEPEPIPLE